MIVVRAAACRGHGEAGAVLEGHHRRQRQQRLGQVGLELVEDRLAQARRHADRHQFADAADRILVLAHFLDQRDHLRGGFAGSGQRTGVASTCSSVTAVGSGMSATTSPTCLT